MVEIIPQPSRRPLLSQSFLFIAAALLFLGVMSGFFVLKHLQSNAREILQALEETLGGKTALEERDLEKELLAAKKKIDDFGVVIHGRKDFLPFFGFLEDTTHPAIFFKKFEANFEHNTVLLSGTTPDFRILEQQRLFWESRKGKELQGSSIRNLTLAKEGGGEFDVEFEFTPEPPPLNLPWIFKEDLQE